MLIMPLLCLLFAFHYNYKLSHIISVKQANNVRLIKLQFTEMYTAQGSLWVQWDV